MRGCPSSLSWRLASTEQSSVFFEPVEFDFELADLLVEGRSERFLILGDAGAALSEDVWQFRQRLFLPDSPGLSGKISTY